MKILIISLFISINFVHAKTPNDQVKKCALEFINAELSGVHIDGKQSCLAKNKFELNKIAPDIYAELNLSELKYVNFESVSVLKIEKIHKKFERYNAKFSVKSENGKQTFTDDINFSINSKKNKERYGFGNLIKGTERVYLRSDCK